MLLVFSRFSFSVDVPVGDDQVQHVELARDIIDHFNHQYNVNFNLPQAEVFEGSRIMSLSDGTKKMSKSSQSQYSNISIIGRLKWHLFIH